MTKKATKQAALTTGERVIAFIHEYCRVPEGVHTGKPMRLDPFQIKFILEVYDNPHGTSRAILSIARKNGKTALIAALCLAHVVGPVAVLNSQIITGAQSREQAGLVYKLMVKMIQLEPRLHGLVKMAPSIKTLIGLRKNVEFKALAAEAKTAHGLSPIVAVLDETGQVKGPQDDFVDAIETSQGAHASPLLFVISTQAASDTDLLSLWIDDAKQSQDPTIVCHVYEAPKDCDLLDEDGWKAANPGLDSFRSRADLAKLANKALRMPSFAATFRNLNLNQRVETVNAFVTKDVWDANDGTPDDLAGKTVYGGLDLSAVSDLTALVLTTEDGDVHPTFWVPEDGLIERGKEARAPYAVWRDEGYLQTTPGASVEYEYIAECLRGVFDRCDVKAIAFDRYNMRFLRPWLVRAGFTDEELERFVDFGQGFVSMSPALRDLESRLVNKKLRHGGHPVLRMCAANATVLTDTSGNRKFVKAKARGRIDGMVALAMSIGCMPSAATVDEELSVYDLIARQPKRQEQAEEP